MIVGTQHVVVALNLMIDVVYAGPGSWRQGNRMMYRVDSHQRDIADTVTDARVANLRPEPLVSQRIGRAKADMAETCYASVPRCKVTLAATFRSNHQFDVVAGRVLEADKCLDLAQRAFVRRSRVHGVP